MDSGWSVCSSGREYIIKTCILYKYLRSIATCNAYASAILYYSCTCVYTRRRALTEKKKQTTNNNDRFPTIVWIFAENNMQSMRIVRCDDQNSYKTRKIVFLSMTRARTTFIRFFFFCFVFSTVRAFENNGGEKNVNINIARNTFKWKPYDSRALVNYYVCRISILLWSVAKPIQYSRVT